MFKQKLPTFARCADGKYYEDLVYQDSPLRRAWFICFSPKEPAEIVIRAREQTACMDPREILKARGFGPCLLSLFRGRKEEHMRFFGAEEGKPIDGHKAISWFLVLKKGVALPSPDGNDVCTEIYSFFPNKDGVYFGEHR